MGAHIGVVSLHLAHAFPDSRVVCVETEEADFELLEKNVASVAPRVSPVHAAVWSHSDGVEYALDAEEDAFVVSGDLAAGRRALAPSIAPGELVDMFGGEPIDLVKMDVEGAEKELLLGADVSWLDSVRCTGVEVHAADPMESIA